MGLAVHVIAEVSGGSVRCGCECGKALRENQLEAPAFQVGMLRE